MSPEQGIDHVIGDRANSVERAKSDRRPYTQGAMTVAKILLIDDEADLRALIKRILERDGHTVTVAESGRIVADAVVSGDFAAAFDLIITDIVMPDVEGLETIKLLKQANPRVKVIAMSGGGHTATPESYLEMARRVGANATIAKPFSVAELMNAMETLLATP
jgi:CheY-like chemotaxis protein